MQLLMHPDTWLLFSGHSDRGEMQEGGQSLDQWSVALEGKFAKGVVAT